jgi:cell wall-associated NlpC family hydrolase
VPLPDPRRAEIVATALGLRGTPYRNGGSDPSGFDCSGFVQYVFAQHATRLPRETVQQFRAGEAVAIEALQPGDLIFFETVAPGASHVGVAIGGEQFIHAPSSRGVVRVERYTATYWSGRLVGARRVVTPAASPAAP